jgi:hypothetical protein
MSRVLEKGEGHQMSSGLLFDWLRLSNPDSTDPAFARIDVSEIRPFDDRVASAIAKALIEARVDPAVSAGLLRRLGKSRYEEVIAAAVDPSKDRTRRGDFGEILAAYAMENALGYEVPVKKLRYAKMRNDDQPRGIDVVALRSADGVRLTEVCYLESKLRTGKDAAFGVEAHDQLMKAWQTNTPVCHIFLMNVLADKGHPLLESLMDFMANVSQCETTFCIALHSDAEAWSDNTLVNLSKAPPSLSPLTVLICKMAELSRSVDACFEAIGVSLVDEDD